MINCWHAYRLLETAGRFWRMFWLGFKLALMLQT
jgi:hypothetical protein